MLTMTQWLNICFQALVSAINGDTIDDKQIEERLANMLLGYFPDWRSCTTTDNSKVEEDVQPSCKGAKKAGLGQRIRRFFLRKSGRSRHEKNVNSPKCKQYLFGCILAQNDDSVVAPEAEVGLDEKRCGSPSPRDKQNAVKPK